MTMPPQIARARLLAGVLLMITLAVIIVALVLLANWLMNRPVAV